MKSHLFVSRGYPVHYMIRFRTSMFDVTEEERNPINPIAGQSLLLWLKRKFARSLEIEEPAVEDWGWYSFMAWKGRRYLLGSTALELDENMNEWVFQVEKQRSLIEKLFAKENMTREDECLLFFKDVFEAEPGFRAVEIE